MTINLYHVIGIVFTLALIAGVGLYSGSKVKNAEDFTTGGGKAGSLLVCGAIMGSLVSGQATIGTAQLAFTFGMSAWWYTLGAGIGCLILGVGYAIPMRRSGSVTLMQVISEEYGEKAGYLGSVLCSIGIFISVIAQVLAACALITTIFPVNTLTAGIISILLMTVYVVFGGAWGAGMGGVVKLILLYIASVVGCIIVLAVSGGPANLIGAIRNLLVGTDLGAVAGISNASDVSHTFLNMLARGTAKDLGSGLSLFLGVLSTQTYAQAIWSGKSDSAGRKGALLSACLIPPIGIACILIGLFMRGHYITTEEINALTAAGQTVPDGLKEIASTSQVFPVFIVDHMPALFGGIVLGTLFITVVGGGAGLSFGVATILVNDIFKKVSSRIDTAVKTLVTTRITIVIVLTLAMLVAIIVPGAIINDFGFLSMGLRGTVVFLPVTGALFMKGKIQPNWVVVSIVLGPIAVLAGNVINLPFDSLFAGLAVSLICMIIGRIETWRHEHHMTGSCKMAR